MMKEKAGDTLFDDNKKTGSVRADYLCRYFIVTALHNVVRPQLNGWSKIDEAVLEIGCGQQTDGQWFKATLPVDLNSMRPHPRNRVNSTDPESDSGYDIVIFPLDPGEIRSQLQHAPEG